MEKYSTGMFDLPPSLSSQLVEHLGVKMWLHCNDHHLKAQNLYRASYHQSVPSIKGSRLY